MSINSVNISGNLTRDAQLRETNGTGTPVLNFSIAVNDRRKNQTTGEWEDYANYVDCVIFGNRASSLAQYLTKGVKVAINGKLRYSSWQDKDNPEKKRSSLNVLVDDIEFMSSRNGNGGNDAGASAPASAPVAESGATDDDIPF